MCLLWGHWAKVSLGTAGLPLESHTQTNKAADQDVPIGTSLCSSHQHCVCLHCPSVSGACLCFPLVITSSSHREHTSWNGFPHTGHYHVMKECCHCLDLFAPAFIKAKERKEDIPWYAAHTINRTLEGCSLYPAQVTAILKSLFSNSPSLVLYDGHLTEIMSGNAASCQLKEI